MQLKKILYVVLVAIMMFSLAAFGIAAEGEEQPDGVAETTLSATVSAKDNVVKPGTSFDYALNLVNNPGIEAIDITINYNPEVLKFNGFSAGKVFGEGDYFDAYEENGTVRVMAFILSGEVADGDGTIVTYNFTVLEGVDQDINDLTIVTRSDVFSILKADKNSTDLDNVVTVVDCGAIKAHNYTSETTDPTCTANSKTIYTCSGCNDVYEVENEGSMLPHTPVAGEGKEATCTEEGLTPGSYCSVCKTPIEVQVTIPVIDHNYVPGEAKDPTCTEPGNTAGTFCSECGLAGEAQDPIPALGHSYPDEWTTVKEPTVREEGKAERECLNGCGEKETKSIAKLPAPPAPTMTSSPSEPWIKGTETGLQFVSSADREYFTGVSVDGKVLANTDYAINSNDTTVTLTAAYLESLEEGEHTISIDSEFGSATAKFTVEEKSNTAVIVIIIVVAVVVVGVVATVVVLKKKELI